MPRKSFIKTDFEYFNYQILICLFLIIINLAVFWQVRNFEFVSFDDPVYITENLQVRRGLSISGILWALSTTDAANWHPLTWLSHITDVHFFGMDSGAHHLVNLFFHVINTILLYVCFRKMTGQIWHSSFLAVLFAIHPLHVESVAWVAERKDVLSAFFWMLAMLNYVLYVQCHKKFNYFVSLLFFILGLMAKPMLVTLPFVLILLDYWPLNRFPSNTAALFSISPVDLDQGNHKTISKKDTILFTFFCRAVEKIPFFIFALASCVITFLVQRSGGSVSSLDNVAISSRFINVLTSYISYVRKMIWPIDLAAFYPYYDKQSLWKALLAFLILAAIFGLVIDRIKRQPYLAVGWFWFIGTMVPVIGLVQVGFQSMADRYTYLPLIGLFIIIIWGADELLSGIHHKKIILISTAATVILSLSVLSWYQAKCWTNDILLFEKALDVRKHGNSGYNNLITSLEASEKESVFHFQKALRLHLDDEKEQEKNLLHILRRTANVYQEIKHTKRALKQYPDNRSIRYQLGMLLRQKTKLENNLQGHHAGLYERAGDRLKHNTKLDEAIYYYEKSVSIDPKFIKTIKKLAVTYAMRGAYNKAILRFKSILAIQPHNIEACYYLASIYARQNNKSESVKWLQNSIDNGFNNWKLLETDPNLKVIKTTPFYKELMGAY